MTQTNNAEFRLGDMVRGGPRLHRQQTSTGKAYQYGREWKPYPFDEAPIEGVFIGWRTYSNGYAEYVGSEEGNVFVPESTIKVALIVRTERENPIPVMFDSIEIEAQEDQNMPDGCFDGLDDEDTRIGGTD